MAPFCQAGAHSLNKPRTLLKGQKGAPGKISCPQLNTHSILSLEK